MDTVQAGPRTAAAVLAALAFAALTAACGGDADSTEQPDTPEGTPMVDSEPTPPADLRSIHARVLEREPTLESLTGQALRVGQQCLADPEGDACRQGRLDLPPSLRRQVDGALVETRRVAEEAAARLELCRQGDVAALEARYPGHLAFYRLVASPPPPIDEAMDAAAAIAISGNVVSKATRVLEQGLAREALDVQVRSPGAQSGYSPNPFAQQRNSVPNLFRGHYTPAIERKMAQARPDCDAYRNSPAIQGACRRDLTVEIIGDWLQSRGHRSVRIILGQQTARPEFELLFQRLLPGVTVRFDPEFDRKLSASSTFAGEMCRAGGEMWTDYEFYVRTLLR